MTEHSSKDKLLANIKNNFRKLGLELDTLPPVLQNDASILAHSEGMLVDACQLVVHATCWTELALKWLPQVGTPLAQPEAEHSFVEPNTLSQLFYEEQTIPFKEARARFDNSFTLLIGKITDMDDAILFGSPVQNNLTMAGMIHRYISELYVQDHFRIRMWKKGLGWI